MGFLVEQQPNIARDTKKTAACSDVSQTAASAHQRSSNLISQIPTTCYQYCFIIIIFFFFFIFFINSTEKE